MSEASADRRGLLRFLLGGSASAAAAVVVTPSPAEATTPDPDTIDGGTP